MAASGIRALARFARLGDDQATLLTVLKDQLGIDAAESLEIRMQLADICTAWSMARIRHQKAAEQEAEAQIA